VRILAVGGGGGGGSGHANAGYAGGGGGSGRVAQIVVPSSNVPVGPVNVTVGAGGQAAAVLPACRGPPRRGTVHGTARTGSLPPLAPC
jgi:hypothetical protein